MGFPQIASVGFSGEAVDTNVHNVVMPAGITPGDLLLLLIGFDARTEAQNMPAGWTRRVSFGSYPAKSYIGIEVWEKVADGTEIDFTYDILDNTGFDHIDGKPVQQKSVNNVLRVTGWDGITTPRYRSGGNAATFRSWVSSSTSAPWGVDNNSFITSYHMNRRGVSSGLAIAYPPGTINQRTGHDGSAGPGGVSFGIAKLEEATDRAYNYGDLMFVTDHYSRIMHGEIIVRGT